jgi:uncharacterized OB-fold protein
MSRIPEKHTLVLYRCPTGHEYVWRHTRCPECGLELVAGPVDAEGVIVCQTVVRVNPRGRPFRLGLAELPTGARTLCLLADDVSTENGAPVRLSLIGDLYHAERAR